MSDFLRFVFPFAPESREKALAREILAKLKMDFVSDEQRKAVFASIADSATSNDKPKLGKGLEEIDTFTGGKAVMTSDGKIIKNTEGPRSHTQIFARMVENDPEKYDRRAVDWAKEVIKTDKEEFSALESAAMDKNGAIKLERDFMGNLTVVYSDGGLRATSDQFNSLYRKVKSAVRSGRISIPKAERIAIHYNSSLAGIGYWDIDTISGFSVNEFGRPIAREKELNRDILAEIPFLGGYTTSHGEIIWNADVQNLMTQKGGEGSGNFGHAGRPGEVGGSAASGSLSYFEKASKNLKSIHLENKRGLSWDGYNGEIEKTLEVVDKFDPKYLSDLNVVLIHPDSKDEITGGEYFINNKTAYVRISPSSPQFLAHEIAHHLFRDDDFTKYFKQRFMEGRSWSINDEEDFAASLSFLATGLYTNQQPEPVKEYWNYISKKL